MVKQKKNIKNVTKEIVLGIANVKTIETFSLCIIATVHSAVCPPLPPSPDCLRWPFTRLAWLIRIVSVATVFGSPWCL